MYKTLTISEKLTEIRTYDGEKFFIKIDTEEFQKIFEENVKIPHKTFSLSLHNDKIIKFSSIKDFGNASDVDFIKIFVIPKLPWQIKTRLNDMLNRAELNGFLPSKNAILAKISELENEFKT